MKVAIVHDWFVGGGAERVVQEIHKQYPSAPIYTSYCSPSWRQELESADIRISYMQHWPFSKLRKFLPPLRGLWFSRLDLGEYDLVISSSGAEAKFVKAREGAKHVSYIHAPTHYYWSRYDQYLAEPGFGFFDWLARIGLKLLVGPMRRWDHKAAQRPDYLIANSSFTKGEIKKYYGRDSVVINPPVDVERFSGHGQSDNDRHGFVTAGRQTPYKRIDLAVEAAANLDVPLFVIGRGPEHRKLTKMAGSNTTFLTRVSDEEMPEKFGEAKAFIFPGVDDFGIVAVEAMAAGTPVIAYKDGGALDYVNSKTGIFFDEPTVESLAAAIGKLENTNFNHSTISAQSAKFSSTNFQKNIKEFIKSIA